MELDAKQIAELKEAELEIFRAFLTVCEKLQLRYYVLGGTLLGAVRHQGFIPWDDDIDIGMPRADYEVFVAEGQKYLPEHLFIQTHRTDPAYPNNFAKIRNSNTAFIESAVKDIPINHGVFVDVFPLDRCEEKKKRKRFEALNTLYGLRLYLVFSLERPRRLRTTLFNTALKILFPSGRRVVEKRERLYTSMPAGPLMANFSGAWGEKEIMPAQWYAEPKVLSFEGLEVNAPAEYEKWLTHVYGDYRKLPPVEKQVTHHYTEVIDLEKSYKYYSKEQ